MVWCVVVSMIIYNSSCARISKYIENRQRYSETFIAYHTFYDLCFMMYVLILCQHTNTIILFIIFPQSLFNLFALPLSMLLISLPLSLSLSLSRATSLKAWWLNGTALLDSCSHPTTTPRPSTCGLPAAYWPRCSLVACFSQVNSTCHSLIQENMKKSMDTWTGELLSLRPLLAVYVITI